jgi:hypothetical protein
VTALISPPHERDDEHRDEQQAEPRSDAVAERGERARDRDRRRQHRQPRALARESLREDGRHRHQQGRGGELLDAALQGIGVQHVGLDRDGGAHSAQHPIARHAPQQRVDRQGAHRGGERVIHLVAPGEVRVDQLGDRAERRLAAPRIADSDHPLHDEVVGGVVADARAPGVGEVLGEVHLKADVDDARVPGPRRCAGDQRRRADRSEGHEPRERRPRYALDPGPAQRAGPRREREPAHGERERDIAGGRGHPVDVGHKRADGDEQREADGQHQAGRQPARPQPAHEQSSARAESE